MAIKDNKDFTITGRTTNFDETGIVTASITAFCGSATAISKAQGMKSHPSYPWLKRSSGTVTFQEANTATISLSFEGVDPDSDGQVTTTIDASMSNEPIDTHPTFTEWSKKFNAKLAPDGSFKKFPPKLDAGGVNNKSGITSYLDPTITYSQTKIFAKAAISQLASEVGNIGKIDSSFYTGTGIPPAPTPDGDGGWKRNWLLLSGSFEEIGEGGKVTKVWKLSGRRGWDKLIYS